LDNGRTGKGRRNSGGAGGGGSGGSTGLGVTGISGSSGLNPLHDFHRWINAAKQRLPAVWTNSVANRGMTLQISAPLPTSSAGSKQQQQPLEAEKTGHVMPSNLDDLTTNQYSTSVGPHELPVLDTSQPGRLARSSSEACARDLTGMRGLRGFTKNPSAQFSAPQQQSPHYGDSVSHPSADHIHGVVPGSRPDPPTIHLYPPSPTQTTYSHHSTSLESDPLHSKQLWSYGSHSEDSGCPNTQTDLREADQTGEVASNTLGVTHADSIAPNSMEADIPVRRTSLESRIQGDPQSQRTVPLLQRQGAFRGLPQWRIIPGPLAPTDRGRPAGTTLNVTEGTTLSSLLFPNNPEPVLESIKPQQPPLAMPSQLPHGPLCNVSTAPRTMGLPQVNDGKVNVNRLLHGLESSTDGHFSAPPSTPSGRLHFVWSDLLVESNPLPVSSASPMVGTSVASEWRDVTNRTTDIPSGVNLSTYLSGENYALKQESNLLDSRPLGEATNTGESGHTVNEMQSRQPVSSVNQREQQQQQTEAHDQERLTRGAGDSVGQPFNTLLTTSSSSEQSSTQRPPSSGPIHLLTHSDIHQLLSLTNIRVSSVLSC
uniref:Protein kinase domain-containing protein n=1 Tax=Echinostoma caproni TaxID=27848 RepID=A0A183B0I9_9TREM